MPGRWKTCSILLTLLACSGWAQDPFQLQVYKYETLPRAVWTAGDP
jgi:hypothetical protein